MYKKGYYYTTFWQTFDFWGTPGQGSADWLVGQGAYSLKNRPSKTLNWVAYAWQRDAGAKKWKGGCSDSTWTQSKWQLQASRPSGSSEGSEGERYNAVCGNNICEATETNISCSSDCQVPAVPGDVVNAVSYGDLQSAANAANGKTLYIPPGTYMTSGLTINGPTQVIAPGTILKPTGGEAVLSVKRATTIIGIGIDGNGSGAMAINLSNTSGVTIQDCTIRNINHSPASIQADNATSFKILHCTIENNSHSGVTMAYSHQGTLDYNTVTNSGGCGMYWWGGDADWRKGPISGNGVSDLTFIGNIIKHSGLKWGSQSCGAAIFGSLGENITMKNNYVDWCGDVCLDPEGGTNFTIEDNYVKNGKNGGITTFYRASHALINHNTVVQESGFQNGIKIYGQGTSQYHTITNNTITVNGSNGIMSYHNTLSNSTISGNDITVTGSGHGIAIDGGDENTISNNTIH